MPGMRFGRNGGSATGAARLVAIGLACAGALSTSRAVADDDLDALVLRDGTRLRGHVLSAPPSGDVVIETTDHAKRVVQRADVQAIELRTAPSAVPSASPKATASPAGVDGATRAKPRRRPEARATDDAAGDDDTDCDDDEEDCDVSTEGGGPAGLGVGYSRETARSRHGPRNGAVNFTLSLGGQLGFGKNITLYGGNGAISVRFLIGSRFPGRRGGSWFGAYFEPTAGGGYVGVSVKQERICVSGAGCFGGGTTSSSAGTFLGTFGAGVQWMHFGSIDVRTKKQSGFGLALGGLVGYQDTFFSGGSSGSVTYGPQLSLIFPSYNAGTASFSALQFNVLVLPTKDFVVILGGLQLSFG